MLVPRKVFVIHLDVKIRLHFRPNGSNLCPSFLNYSRSRWGWTLKCWENPTTLGFPTKKWSWLGVFWGVPPFKETLRCFCQTKIFSNFPGLHFSDLRLSVTTWFMHEKLKLKRTVSDWKEPKINGSIRISVTSFFTKKKEWLKIRSLLKTEQTSHIPSLFLGRNSGPNAFSNILSPVVDGNQKSLSPPFGWCWNLVPGWDSTRRTSCEGETATKRQKKYRYKTKWLVG